MSTVPAPPEPPEIPELPELVDNLLIPALGHAVAYVASIPPGALDHPSPCAAWSVGEVIQHLVGSLELLSHSLDSRAVPPPAAPTTSSRGSSGPPAIEVARVARSFLAAARRSNVLSVAVDGQVLHPAELVVVASLEAAVHGWDAASGAGTAHPLTDGLASRLLHCLPRFVNRRTRGTWFAPPTPIPLDASPSDRLLAALGRHPHAAA